jgi:hypothetical protein
MFDSRLIPNADIKTVHENSTAILIYPLYAMRQMYAPFPTMMRTQDVKQVAVKPQSWHLVTGPRSILIAQAR